MFLNVFEITSYFFSFSRFLDKASFSDFFIHFTNKKKKHLSQRSHFVFLSIFILRISFLFTHLRLLYTIVVAAVNDFQSFHPRFYEWSFRFLYLNFSLVFNSIIEQWNNFFFISGLLTIRINFNIIVILGIKYFFAQRLSLFFSFFLYKKKTKNKYPDALHTNEARVREEKIKY